METSLSGAVILVCLGDFFQPALDFLNTHTALHGVAAGSLLVTEFFCILL